MSYGLIDYNTLKDIGDSIREKANTNANYYPRDMARAIRQIKTGDGGFDEPVILSLSSNRVPYPNFNSGITDFEFLNSIPENSQENGSFTLVEEDCSIVGLSPDKVSLYFHPGPNGTNYAFYVDGNKWMANQVSILDMSSMFNGASALRHAFCGKYTTKMYNTFASCQLIPTAYCGEYVSDMSYAYSYCSNIRNAVCGNNVKNMAFAYTGCSNLLRPAIGPNVENIAYTYSGCYYLTGDIVIPQTTKCISSAFNYCNNLNSITGDVSNVIDASNGFGSLDYNNVFVDWANFRWDSLENASYLFNNSRNLTDSEGFLNLRDASYMYSNCVNLRNVKIYSQNITNMYGMFENCHNLTEESQNNIISLIQNLNNTIISGQYLFSHCNMTNVHLVNELGRKSTGSYSYYIFQNMYSGVPIENVTWDDNITDIGQVFTGSGIMYAVWPETAINAVNTYQYCPNLITAACGPLVTNMYMTYYGCNNLIQANIGDNVTYAYATYAYCNTLTEAVCGNSVITMQETFSRCPNLINAACSDSVVSMFFAYQYCNNLRHAVVGNNVTNLQGAYQHCPNLEGDVEIPNESLNIMGYAFLNANNLQNIVIKSKAIPAGAQYIQNAFNRSYNYVRRNIVLTNLNSFNNFTYRTYNALGTSVYLTNETYAESVPVNVNGVNYDAVRCAYSTSYNVYVYCTE